MASTAHHCSVQVQRHACVIQLQLRAHTMLCPHSAQCRPDNPAVQAHNLDSRIMHITNYAVNKHNRLTGRTAQRGGQQHQVEPGRPQASFKQQYPLPLQDAWLVAACLKIETSAAHNHVELRRSQASVLKQHVLPVQSMLQLHDFQCCRCAALHITMVRQCMTCIYCVGASSTPDLLVCLCLSKHSHAC